MIRRLGHRFAAVFRSATPDPFVLAVCLTLTVFVLAALVEDASPLSIIAAWQSDSGFWSLLEFSMQMVLILVTGHALASSPAISAALTRLAHLPRTGGQAAALVSFVAISTALINWGLGLIVGAILAREVGRSCEARQVAAHYPLVAAAGYTGLMCWHGGVSGTAPLMMTELANVERFLGTEMASRVGVLPLTETIFATPNLVVTGGLLILVPALCAALSPEADSATSQGAYLTEAGSTPTALETASEHSDSMHSGVAERLENSRAFTWVLLLPLLAAIALWFNDKSIAHLDPNALNLLFLTAGLIMHGTLRRYIDAITAATSGAAGIVLQFPLYAGIMGVMRGTGLGRTVATSMTRFAPARFYPHVTVLSAGVINFFVPSGGGQWAVQGPIAVEASTRLGTRLSDVVMAVAYGDQLTNMLQPFWALPLLAVTQVRARDIVGYTALLMCGGGAWVMVCLTALAG